MAETKTYKGKKNGYYPETPDRHQGGRLDLLFGPVDQTHEIGMQNAPDGKNHGQFGRADGKSEASNP